jgi:hypothetical protein
MSVETAMSMEEARRKAEHEARYELGTFVRVGPGKLDEEAGEFQFPLLIRSPKIITDGHQEEVTDVRYFSELDLGTLTIDATTGKLDRPNRSTIRRKVREHENEVEIAVQKALISSAGRKLSHLPFPENQYSPLQDILSEILLHKEISMAQIEMMDEERSNNRYREYVEKLVTLDLLNRRGGTITAGSVLVSLYDEKDTLQETLNAAMGRYFEHNVGEFNMIKRTLGPYLVVAGRYYRRALELEEMPVIDESELRRAIEYEYSGRTREEKLFKLSRYLIQLEDVGILESVSQNGGRYWSGDEAIYRDLRQHSDYLASAGTLLV